MSDEIKVGGGSGNVFADLGLADAELRLAKAELSRLISHSIRGRGVTQREAAKLLGVAQPEVSDLMRGRLSRFSMERLERMLNALDMDIRIQVASRPTWKPHAGISVEFVAA